MRVYLCGQRYFGQEVLRLLLRLGHEVVGVSAPPESTPGKPDRLFALADTHRLPLLPAGRLTAETLPPQVDLIIAAHAHDFIGRKTRLRSRLGAIGYHPSLLPLHRGRDAVRWTMHMRERITGGTVFWLDDTVDGGPIAAQDWCLVRPGWAAQDLWREALQPMGLRLLERTLGDIGRGVLVRVPQDHSLATWEPSFDRPPLPRPDLALIGPGSLSGYQVVMDTEALHAQTRA